MSSKNSLLLASAILDDMMKKALCIIDHTLRTRVQSAYFRSFAQFPEELSPQPSGREGCNK